MGEILRLDKKVLDQLAEIDFESGHEMGMARGITLQDCKAELTGRFAGGNELFFGYMDEGILKGYATMKPFFPGYRHCELYWLSVSKKYQCKGIGTALMEHIEDYARKQRFRKICIYTNKLMKETRRFYEKRGYVFINEFPGYYGYEDASKNTAVLYSKVL